MTSNAPRAQEKRKLSKDETTPGRGGSDALVDAVAAGKQPAPSDVKLTWHNHFLLTGKTDIYVPYTLDFEPGVSTGACGDVRARGGQDPRGGRPCWRQS